MRQHALWFQRRMYQRRWETIQVRLQRRVQRKWEILQKYDISHVKQNININWTDLDVSTEIIKTIDKRCMQWGDLTKMKKIVAVGASVPRVIFLDF